MRTIPIRVSTMKKNQIFVTLKHSLIIFLSIHVLDVSCIDGGQRAGVGQFKYVVSIRHQQKHFCTGSIIHKSYVLTAKHCMLTRPIEEMYIYAGIIDMEDPNLKVLTIAKIYTYPIRELINSEPHSIFTYYHHDIAMLKLNQELVWTPTLAPASVIKKEHFWDPCEICMVPGWDFPDESDIPVIYLLFVHAYVLSEEECLSRVGVLHPHHKCAFDDIGDGIIYPGDSGTPFICNNALVGIIVGGYEDRDVPSIMMDMSPYLPFISEIIDDGKIDVKLGEFPYIVSIWRGDSYVCGGTIIDRFVILTAGHCIRGIEAKDLRIAAGRTQVFPRDPTINWFYIDSIDIRKTASDSYYDVPREYKRNDVATIRLKTSLPSDPNIARVILPSPDEIHTKIWQHCKVFRWIPELSEKVGVSRKLVWLTGTLLPRDYCRELGIFLESNEFCTASPFEFPLSDHDAGGTPFVCESLMHGILTGVPPTLPTPSLKAILIKIPTYLK